ncbi:retrovirus-related pol polyprotein from transposon TNT 1-94 [Tanacetum coccineum]
MAAAGDLKEIEEVNANCILMDNLQQALTSDTLDPLSQKLENENVELEFQVLNYAKENKHLKTTYKNLFDSIKVTQVQTKLITDSLQEKLHDTIYENAMLRAQLFDKVLPKIDDSNALSNPVTLNSAPSTRKSPVVQNDKVIAPGMFRINLFKTSREDKFVPINKVRASVRINPITISQPHVITKKYVNSDSNGLFSTRVDNTAKTRRPQPRSNTKNNRVPSASKSSCIKNKEVEVEEHHRNLLLSKNNKQMSSEVVCVMCNQCLITANHDVCVLNYANGMNSHGKKQKANVSNIVNQIKLKLKVRKHNQVGFKERLASHKPRKPRTYLRWSPTKRIFDLKGKIIASSKSECQSNIPIGLPNLFMVHQLGVLKAYDSKFEASNKLCLEVLRNRKRKKASYPPKPVPNSKQRLHLLHMDWCGPMRVKSINGKRYVLVIVDDYSRYTWVLFLRSKDKAPEEIKIFLKKITILLQALVIIVRTKNDIEFKNQVLQEYFNSVGISHQASSVRTPQQNGVVE